jgi:hypothetical protein
MSQAGVLRLAFWVDMKQGSRRGEGKKGVKVIAQVEAGSKGKLLSR